MNKLLLVLVFLFVFTITSEAQQYEFSNPNQRTIENNDNANASGIERFNLHFQTTYVGQYKPAFNSKYQSVNSLDSAEDVQNSVTATLFLGIRLWKGAEVYVNPELAGGSGLSNSLGMAGSSNGETYRIAGATTLYLARAYFKQTFTLRNKWARKTGNLNKDEIESYQNKLAGYEPKNYLRFFAGKLSLADLFDNNIYSNSPRTQFLNWSLMNNGAWDYAANNRGYTGAFATELRLGKMNYKAGVAMLPTFIIGPELNTDLSDAIALNVQLSRAIAIHKRPGNIHLLSYYHSGHFGEYAAAILQPYPNASYSIKTTTKLGIGLNIDQQLSNTFGAFMRIGWNDGKNATWCFTEIDQTFQLGISANGHKWKRPNDNCGLAVVMNGISTDHRQYLAKGGYGLMLGDGKLSYAPEFITEFYYSFKPVKSGIWFTPDYQFCLNPGYNTDRGPVHIFSFRAHIEL